MSQSEQNSRMPSGTEAKIGINCKDQVLKPPTRNSKARRQFQCCIARECKIIGYLLLQGIWGVSYLADYTEYSNMVDSLHITPRMMIHHKCFKVNNTYGLSLNIKNTGLVSSQKQLNLYLFTRINNYNLTQVIFKL